MARMTVYFEKPEQIKKTADVLATFARKNFETSIEIEKSDDRIEIEGNEKFLAKLYNFIELSKRVLGTEEIYMSPSVIRCINKISA